MLAATASSTNAMTRTIHVRLLNEGTDVCRPTEGREIGDGVYEILPTADYDPSDEEWEFPPGSCVRIAKRAPLDEGEYFIAVAE
jgi:hypothetical protein